MLSYILKELVRYNVHLGHYYWECNNLLGYFLLGTRNLINIINVYNTIYNLKKILYIVFNLGIIKQRILLTNNIHYPIKSYLHKLNKDLIYINKKWTGGLLTNQKELYIYNKELFYKFYDLGYRSILPAFVFVTNIENNSSCIFEAMILNIINSSLFDTNLNYYGIFYKICSNDENFAIMMFFIRIIAKVYIKGAYIAFKQLCLRESKWKLKEIKKERNIKIRKLKSKMYKIYNHRRKYFAWEKELYKNKFIRLFSKKQKELIYIKKDILNKKNVKKILSLEKNNNTIGLDYKIEFYETILKYPLKKEYIENQIKILKDNKKKIENMPKNLEKIDNWIKSYENLIEMLPLDLKKEDIDYIKNMITDWKLKKKFIKENKVFSLKGKKRISTKGIVYDEKTVDHFGKLFNKKKEKKEWKEKKEQKFNKKK